MVSGRDNERSVSTTSKAVSVVMAVIGCVFRLTVCGFVRECPFSFGWVRLLGDSPHKQVFEWELVFPVIEGVFSPQKVTKFFYGSP